MSDCGCTADFFWSSTEREIYAIMLANAMNQGARTEWDDPLECCGEGD